MKNRWVSVALLALGLPGLVAANGLRPLTADDLARLEEVEEVAVSPDGKWLAYALRRPLAGESMVKQDFLRGNDRADVWLAATGGGKPTRITDGAADGSGFWSPVWSPDGARLALLSTRGGNVRLWLWQRATGKARLAHDRGVDVQWAEPTMAWVSNSELLCPLLPPGQRPTSMTVEIRAAETAMREWPKAWKGREPTVSVLESGGPVDFAARPEGQLALIDTVRGTTRTLAEGNVRGFRLSPDKQAVAFLRQNGVVRPGPERLLEHMQEAVYGAGVVRLDAGARPTLAPAREALAGSLRWSRDGRSVAFIAKPPADQGDEPRALVLKADGALEIATVADLEPTAVAWSADGHLLVMATPKNADKKRPDWWLARAGEKPANLTAALKSAPAQLVAAADDGLVGVADGDVWRIAADGSAPRNLTAELEPKIASIVWPPAVPERGPAREAIVAVQRERLSDLYRVDLASDHVTALEKPDPEATVLAYAPERDTAVLVANTRRATSLWVSQPAFARHTAVLETNTFLRDVDEGALRQIEYRSLEGEQLKAWVVLPVGYKEGTACPMVTWVYAGSLARETPSILASINRNHSLNLQLLAAHGYAVLLPSMPLRPEKEASDPYMELTKGVLPAVDKAIELGIADPKRLAVMGQSYGGYSTYGLVTQTGRFKAAVALAGLSDLVSLYGQLDARSRYEPYAHERLFSMSIAESGQIRMGNPPWKDIGRYLRNSPLFYADRVTTPLMIIQGDMDYVAIEQGEQFFTALYRQGKRAAFVRYWGEGHVLRSPANVRDMWQRIYAWLDEFLAPEAKKEKA